MVKWMREGGNPKASPIVEIHLKSYERVTCEKCITSCSQAMKTGGMAEKKGRKGVPTLRG